MNHGQTTNMWGALMMIQEWLQEMSACGRRGDWPLLSTRQTNKCYVWWTVALYPQFRTQFPSDPGFARPVGFAGARRPHLPFMFAALISRILIKKYDSISKSRALLFIDISHQQTALRDV
jgi:hypothetical protein